METWLAHAPTQVRHQISASEQREQERLGIAARSPARDWRIERGHDERVVHTGGRHMAGKRSNGATTDQALRAVLDKVDACTHCRPDTELGYL
ncbi:DUF6233 domain-containing protein [Streptomyces sp. Tue6028]|uniref:DUF6233 domain-containing protein n=1 Tax=Streptomyces sp. Tue6028 TaxID=2036037 RepID=UPI003EB86691